MRNKTQALYRRAKALIPGGTQLLSKTPERFHPKLWPPYYSKAKGCNIWDLDGRRYIDMGYMGIGSCILGYADRDVDEAVKRVIDKGSMSTLNSPEEVELAERLCDIHPWAGMAKFARTGGEAMAIAVRIARAKTGRDIVLFCGYHGWHDWYISANLADEEALDGHLLPGLEPKGVPRALRGTAIPFNYNDTKGFLNLIKRYKGKTAAVIMEPIRNYRPAADFLETVRDVTRRSGIALIFDEITSGWRLVLGGAHLKFKVYPDIAVFAKGMSNGYPMAAIIGTSAVMKRAKDTFISSTYWTERIGPSAALATIEKLGRRRVPRHLNETGEVVKSGWETLARKHNLPLSVSGMNPLCHFSFEFKNPLVLKTLFTQGMLERGILASCAFYASYAHKDEEVKLYLGAVDEVFGLISEAVRKGDPEKYIDGEVCQGDFKRLA